MNLPRFLTIWIKRPFNDYVMLLWVDGGLSFVRKRYEKRRAGEVLFSVELRNPHIFWRCSTLFSFAITYVTRVWYNFCWNDLDISQWTPNLKLTNGRRSHGVLDVIWILYAQLIKVLSNRISFVTLRNLISFGNLTIYWQSYENLCPWNLLYFSIRENISIQSFVEFIV